MLWFNLAVVGLVLISNIGYRYRLYVEVQWPHGSALVPGSSSPGSSPGQGHCASLNPGVQMGTAKFNAGSITL